VPEVSVVAASMSDPVSMYDVMLAVSVVTVALSVIVNTSVIEIARVENPSAVEVMDVESGGIGKTFGIVDFGQRNSGGE
jgi:hypothetical protein